MVYKDGINKIIKSYIKQLIILGLLNDFQFQFQYLIYYHTTPWGNFVYKLGTILSSNGPWGP